jgi:hypothetical protein
VIVYLIYKKLNLSKKILSTQLLGSFFSRKNIKICMIRITSTNCILKLMIEKRPLVLYVYQIQLNIVNVPKFFITDSI